MIIKTSKKTIKMQKIIGFLVVLLFTAVSFAQQEKCECSTVFDELVQKIEDNYIVAAQLKIDGNDNAYNNRVKNYKERVKTKTSKTCTKLLTEFVQYFNDEHLFVIENPKYSQEELTSFKSDIKKNKYTVNSILTTLKYEKNTVENNGLDGIIGKWSDGTSELAIVKDEELLQLKTIDFI